MKIRTALRHPLLKLSLVYTLCDSVNKSVPFLILPILSYYLLPSDYGIVSNFNALLAVMTILISIGIDGAVAVNFYKLTKVELSKYIYNALLLVAASAIVCIFLILILGDFIFDWTKIPLKYQLLVIAMSLSAVFTGVNLSIWRLEEQPLKFGIYDIFQTIINIGFSLFFVVYLKMNWVGRVDGMFIASILFGTFSFFLLIRRGYLVFNYDRTFFREALFFGLPLIPHSLSFWIRSGIDRIYITRFIGETATGLYATGFQFGILISFLTLSFNNAFVPYLYKMLSEPNEIILIKNKIKLVKITYFIGLSLIILSVFFIFFSDVIINQFFSSTYRGAKIYVFWAILAQMFQGFYLLFVNYIFFIKKTKELALITFCCSMLQLVLSYILIVRLGAVGGAYSTVIVSFINFLAISFFSYKMFPMPWFKLVTLRKLTNFRD